DGQPVADSVTERIGDHLSVVTEAMSGVTVWPSAGVLELLGQVPVVEGRPGLNAGFQEGVHEAAVEVDTRLVDLPGTLGKDARPGDRETVGVEIELLHQLDVLGITAVVVVGGVTCVSAQDLARGLGEGVPDAGAPPIGGGGAFDLERGGGRPPEEALGRLVAISRCFAPPLPCRRDIAVGAPAQPQQTSVLGSTHLLSSHIQPLPGSTPCRPPAPVFTGRRALPRGVGAGRTTTPENPS